MTHSPTTPANPAQGVSGQDVRTVCEWLANHVGNISLMDWNPCANVFLQAADRLDALTAAIGAGGQAVDDSPVTWQWRVLECGEPRSAWKGPDEGDRAGWEVVAKRKPEKYTIEKRPLYAHPAPSGQAVAVKPRDYETFRTFAHEATKAITNLTGGGSEYFGKEIDGVFLADLPRCVERLRYRLDRAALADGGRDAG